MTALTDATLLDALRPGNDFRAASGLGTSVLTLTTWDGKTITFTGDATPKITVSDPDNVLSRVPGIVSVTGDGTATVTINLQGQPPVILTGSAGPVVTAQQERLDTTVDPTYDELTVRKLTVVENVVAGTTVAAGTNVTAPALSRYDRTQGRPGLIAPAPGGIPYAVGTLAAQANRAYLARFSPSSDITIASMLFQVTVADAGDCEVGIYSTDLTTKLGSQVGTGLADTGSPQQVVLTTPIPLLANGVYFAAFVTAKTPTLMAAVWPNSGGGTLIFAASGVVSDQAAMSRGVSANPLPADASGFSGAAAAVPILALASV